MGEREKREARNERGDEGEDEGGDEGGDKVVVIVDHGPFN